MGELFSLLLLAGIAWLWYDGSRAREAGVQAARDACAAESFQLLDDTIALSSLKPARNDDGQLLLRRVYDFEYSDTGDNRCRGSVVLLGQRVIVLNVGFSRMPAHRTLH